MQKNRFTFILFGVTILVISLLALFFYFKHRLFEGQSVLSENVMVEKITEMGKLELIKYSMKDVLEKKAVRTLLPDQRILFVAAGEVAGCIDLTKVQKKDLVAFGDSLIIFLPKAEICYAKLDHNRSKVYDVSGAWFPDDAKDMVEDIYKVAEQKMLQNALDMNILQQAENNAHLIFKPLLENVSGRKVGIKFR